LRAFPPAKARRRCEGSKGGRPPYDAGLMFKVLIRQTLDPLAGDAAEFQIRDRFSFRRFLGLELHAAVPDAKTIWLLRERLTKAGAIAALFARFETHLKTQGYLAISGQTRALSRRRATPRRRLSRKAPLLRRGTISLRRSRRRTVTHAGR